MAKPFLECDGCMWPVGELFCSAVVPRGNVYCPAHEGVAHRDTSGPVRNYKSTWETPNRRTRVERIVPVDEYMRGAR